MPSGESSEIVSGFLPATVPRPLIVDDMTSTNKQ
jgi:hypothetical protein